MTIRMRDALLALACTACSAPPSPSVVTVADSAGIRLVTYPGALVATDTLRPEPIFEYGFAPTHYEFQFVFSGRIQSDGSVFVGDPSNQEVVKVSASGQSHEIWARQGEGPSEVRLLRSLHLAGHDTLWVEDRGNGKLMLLADRELVGTVPTRDIREVGFGLMAQGLDSEGRFLMSTAAFDSSFEEPWFRGSLVRFDPDARAADTVGHFDMAARATSGKQNPFFYNGVMTLSGQQFVTGRTDAPALTWRRSDGSPRQIVRWTPEVEYPTDAHWSTFVEVLRRELARVNPQMPPARVEEFIREQVESYEVQPDSPLPLFGPLHGTGLGDIWMQPFVAGFAPRPTDFFVIAVDGARVERVEFDDPVHLLDVRDDLVLVAIRDDLDVHGIALYRLPRP